VAAGAFPLVPRRLAYPEVFRAADGGDEFFYDGSAGQLADRLCALAAMAQSGDIWQGNPQRGSRLVEGYTWHRLVPILDSALEAVAHQVVRVA
jgi:hypothetical protein